MSFRRTAGLAVLGLGLCLPLMGAAAVPAAPEANYGAIAADRGPAMVTIKFVISLSHGGDSRDLDREAAGIFIDGKTGLILASNFEMGGGLGAHKDIKVLIGEDTEGVPAKIVGRDSDLELIWVRIEKPSDKGYTAVDPAKGSMPKLGDHLVGLDKMGKYFDRATVLFDTVVGGVAKKPRPLIIPSGGIVQNIGLPMFTTGGEFVGVTVVQRPEDEDASGSSGRSTSFDRGLKILPASEIVTATTRALEAEKSGKALGEEEPKPAAEPGAGGDKKDEKDKVPAPMPKPPEEMPKK